MDLRELTYERIDMEPFQLQWRERLREFKEAPNGEKQKKIIEKLNELRRKFETNEQLAYIFYTMDTQDDYYAGEQEFYDFERPNYENLISEYYQLLLQTSFREDLEKELGAQIFRLAKMHEEVFSKTIIADLQEENRLTTQYTEILSGIKVEFAGVERSLPQLKSFLMAVDDRVRKEAYRVKYQALAQKEKAFDDIFDQLVKVRDRLARKLGYDNFIPVAYKRMMRYGYGPCQVEKLRTYIKQEIVPLTIKIREQQQKRLAKKRLFHWDEALLFADGNAFPKEEGDIIAAAQKMYSELSSETEEFFRFMTDKGLMDLKSRPGKSPGGYCTYLSEYGFPFIFANFNGTSDDVDVLTHEAGHAFQMYLSRDQILPEYYFPTLDACEIHSMSMEFIAWPWMKNFFGTDEQKYIFAHLTESICFLPYGTLVDDFQHQIYIKPEMSPAERKKCWRELEKKYLPYRNYEDCEYLETGNYWHQQGHIFKDPFYYIDYVLAGVCALQYWQKAQKDLASTWDNYLELCRAGGSLSFLELVRLAGMISPFEARLYPELKASVLNWLKK